ncbi:ABC transporter substrate-binding protein [uncultured Arcticibacterium sp.]|uniref:ABC transporter substrate-binding protein n=1 Tax=uncultured Arcticibacterium sp. TaxID=2173042 RepID=UPI0030F59337
MNNHKLNILIGLFFIAIISNCNQEPKEDKEYLKTAPWEQISKEAEGTTVNFMMWQGSTAINNYINNFVIPEVKERYNIDLKISSGQGPEIVQLVMSERDASIDQGQVDMVWINGETFFQLRQVKGLWGPFVEQLPNAKLVNFNDPYIGMDFQQPVGYMEAPWTVSQFAMLYDSTRLNTAPPASLEELTAYVKANPGTFTISNDFTGMTLLKSFMAELGGGSKSLDGAFDEEKYNELSSKLWEYINTNKKYFWKNGETFPNEQSKMNQLYAIGELNILYGFGEGGIENKVNNGLYPKSTVGYPWKNGTVKNSNYLGILHNAPQKAGAMQVINFLLSPEAQLKKASKDGMDSNTILEIDRLTPEMQAKFKEAMQRDYGPTMEELKDYAMAEPAAQYMIRLFEDFRTEVIEK